MNWFILAFKRYAEFNGRSRRKEYWMFFLFNLIISYSLLGADYLLGSMWQSSGLLSSIYSLITFIPNLSVGIRRMHDVGKSGWTYLWFLLPILGWFYIFYLLVKGGDEGANEYGKDPKNPYDELEDIGSSLEV